MIDQLNHIAIAVPDLDSAIAQYKDILGMKVGLPQDLPDHGVTVVFITLPNSKIELLYPLGKDSPIKKFLEKNPNGGIHHICYSVSDMAATIKRLNEKERYTLGSPKVGSHGNLVVFLHPKDFNGTLIELEEIRP